MGYVMYRNGKWVPYVAEGKDVTVEEADRELGELEYQMERQRYFDRMTRGEFVPIPLQKDSPPENHELSQAETLAGTDADGVYRMPGQDEDGMINGRFL